MSGTGRHRRKAGSGAGLDGDVVELREAEKAIDVRESGVALGREVGAHVVDDQPEAGMAFRDGSQLVGFVRDEAHDGDAVALAGGPEGFEVTGVLVQPRVVGRDAKVMRIPIMSGCASQPASASCMSAGDRSGP